MQPVDAHVNQPGGPIVPIAHEAVEGREVELRRLIDAVRRLLEAIVSHVADAASTQRLTAQIEALARDVRRLVPSDVGGRFARDDDGDPDRHPHAGTPWDIVYGLYSPLALPVRMAGDADRVTGDATYTTRFEGPPGCVHGAVIASAFDMVLSSALHRRGGGGPTMQLSLRYRRPTRLHTPLRYESWVAQVEGVSEKVAVTRGHIVQDGEVTVEAEGRFRRFDRQEVAGLASRVGHRPVVRASPSRRGHLNQPDGIFRPSAHPAVAGRERELRWLADAARDLVDAVITFRAGPGETATFAARAERCAATVEALVPEEVPPRYGGARATDPHPHDTFPFDPVLGLYSPMAVPIQVEHVDGAATGDVTFPVAYEGPPGCVHGAVIIGGFDQVFNVANIAAGVPGPTKTLSVDYLRPTLIGRPLRYEAAVTSVEGREVTTEGRIVQDGDTTCRSVGVFVALGADASRLSERRS